MIVRRAVVVVTLLAALVASSGFVSRVESPSVGAPRHLRVSSTTSGISVRFRPPSVPAGTRIVNYEASFSVDNGVRWTEWSAAQPADRTSPVRFTGAPWGTKVRLRLRVVTTEGAGIASSASSRFTVRTRPVSQPPATDAPDTTVAPVQPPPSRSPSTGSPAPSGPSAPTTSPVATAPSTAPATPSPVTPVPTYAPPVGGVEIFVSPSGDDSAAGTRSSPLRTLAAAWARIPRDVVLERPHTITLLAGDYAASTMPHYWEWRRGTAANPITIRSEGPGRPVILRGDLNLFEVHHLRVEGIRILRNGDTVHCERCSFLTLHDVELDGGSGAWETLKVNQSSDVVVTDSVLRNAGDNVVDLVAVQRATIRGNTISGAGDWCLYAKGGSIDVLIESNSVSDCGTGGITAGQGTGLEWMMEPWITYEATNVVIRDNHVFDVEGAAFGVNGGRNVLIEGNRAERVGRRSHLIEVTFGGRSCDGDSARCARLLAAGAWGTASVGNDVYANIPNRDVVIRDNVIVNPPGYRSQWQHFEISAARLNDGARVGPSPASADEGLSIVGNVIVNGDRSMPLGIEGSSVCRPGHPTCTIEQIYRDNDVNGQ